LSAPAQGKKRKGPSVVRERKSLDKQVIRLEKKNFGRENRSYVREGRRRAPVKGRPQSARFGGRCSIFGKKGKPLVKRKKGERVRHVAF